MKFFTNWRFFMKKLWLLLSFAVAMMASQAWSAGTCNTSGGEAGSNAPASVTVAYCEYSGKDCHSINNEYGDNVGKSCSELIAKCIGPDNGSLFSGPGGNLNGALTEANGWGKNVRCGSAGATWTGQGKNPDAQALGCCKWSPGTECWTIWSGTNSEGEDGASKASECQSGANSFWNGACPAEPSCPTSNPVYDGSANDCGNNYCRWPTGCVKITPDPTEGITTCADAISNCQNFGEHFTNSTCSGGQPILTLNPNMGLVVATHGRALHISSDREASITLYTLGGQRVLSGKVSAGNKVFSLMGQNPGVYYAIVQSGSYTQTVNVVLK